LPPLPWFPLCWRASVDPEHELATERTRKREDLLAATEKDLARIKAAVARKRDPLRGTVEIALKVGEVLNIYKMKKHFDLEITETAFSFARKSTEIAAKAATDGIYVVRTSLAGARSSAGNCQNCFFDLRFRVVAHRFLLEMRDVGQFVGRNHAVDDGRAIRLQRLVDGIAQLARLSGPGSP
jgi:hypothetical protein